MITRRSRGEFVADVAPRLGARQARRWYWRQAASILVSVTTDRVDLTRDEPGVKENAHHGRHLAGPSVRDMRAAKAAGFTGVAAMTSALGLGAHVAVFSVLHALRLKPLPYRDAARLMPVHRWCRTAMPGPAATARRPLVVPEVRRIPRPSEVFDRMVRFGSREWSLTDPRSRAPAWRAAGRELLLDPHAYCSRGCVE